MRDTSRHQTGEVLRASGLAVTEFRAGIIVGSGSLSFEMVRYLTDRLPIIYWLGGRRGWLLWNWAWRIRGPIDWPVGGVGMRRGRHDPDEVRVGDAFDFWRVKAVEPGQLLRLRAKMKLPGLAAVPGLVSARRSDSTDTNSLFRAERAIWPTVLVWAIPYLPIDVQRPDQEVSLTGRSASLKMFHVKHPR